MEQSSYVTLESRLLPWKLQYPPRVSISQNTCPWNPALALRKPRLHGEAMCRCSDRHPLASSQWPASWEWTPRHGGRRAKKWFQPADLQAFQLRPRHCAAEIGYLCRALCEFLPTETQGDHNWLWFCFKRLRLESFLTQQKMSDILCPQHCALTVSTYPLVASM